MPPVVSTVASGHLGVFIKHEHTSRLVEALLSRLYVALEDLLLTLISSSLLLPVVWVVSGELVHPGLFGYGSLTDAVIVNKLNLIHHPNRHKLWEG